ncbi:hypothetical protein BX666DRAFT_1152012 [Dichotomocladium elegans]|nr:hypothetical protein BX666DRAFT_1152012 [Dichotomocladium elegans]
MINKYVTSLALSHPILVSVVLAFAHTYTHTHTQVHNRHRYRRAAANTRTDAVCSYGLNLPSLRSFPYPAIISDLELHRISKIVISFSFRLVRF